MPYTPNVAPPQSPSAFRNQFGSQALATAYDATYGDWTNSAQPTIAAVLEQTGKALPITSWLDAVGMKHSVSQNIVSHWEMGPIETPFDVVAVTTAAGGAGNNMVVSVETISLDGNRSGPRVDEVYRTPTDISFRVASISTANPNLVTITPLDSTVDLDNHVTAGDSYTIKSNGGTEAANLFVGQKRRPQKYTNTFQNVREGYGASDVAMTIGTFATFGNIDGVTIADDTDAVYRNEKAKSNAIMFGQQADNITSTDNAFGTAEPIEYTEGLYTFYDELGNDEEYNKGAFQVQDFDTIDTYMVSQGLTNSTMTWYSGNLLMQQISAALKEYVTNTGVDLKEQIAGETGVRNGFMAFEKDGRTHVVQRCGEFCDPWGGGGSANYEFRERALIVPQGWAAGMSEDGQLNGEEYPLVGYACAKSTSSGKEYENLMVVKDGTGMNTQIATSDYAAMQVTWRSRVAAHASRANQGTVLKPR